MRLSVVGACEGGPKGCFAQVQLTQNGSARGAREASRSANSRRTTTTTTTSTTSTAAAATTTNNNNNNASNNNNNASNNIRTQGQPVARGTQLAAELERRALQLGPVLCCLGGTTCLTLLVSYRFICFLRHCLSNTAD